LPHVASNVQAASSNIISPSSSINPKSKRNGKELVEFVEPLEKKSQRFYEKTHVCQDTWAYCFPRVVTVVGEDGFIA
jgi:hypothetical protein